ncbi:glycosyltransferase [Candidatus Sumerlaeota bacterium]|nr:glycosyltransferase [Candidatus Sumerlaeota bacterium]
MDERDSQSGLRTLHIDTGLEWRGGQNQSWQLCLGLLARGHEVLALAQPGSPWAERLREAGVEVREIRMRGEFDPIAVRGIRRAIREFKPHLIHTHTAHAHGLAVWAAGRRPDIPVVVSRRVDFAIGGNWLSRRKYGHPVCRYLAISNGVRDVLIDGGIPAERIRIAPSGVDPMRFEGAHDRAKARGELGLDDGAFAILNVAALTDHKDQTTLIRAAQGVVRQAENATVLIAGEGELQPELERLIAELGLAGKVRLLGHRADVPELLAASDLFVMSSKLEGLCTSIIDAMLMRAPVVACAAGGIPDLVIHEQTGLLAPPQEPQALTEAILRLHGDAALRERLAEAAHKHAMQHFTCDSMVEATLRAYREFLES